MLALATWMLHLVLAAYLAWECAKAPREYRALKAALDRGEPRARLDFYRKTLVFEWATCALAAAVLALHPGMLHASAEALGQLAFVKRYAVLAREGALTGMFVGVGVGMLVALVVQRLLAMRRNNGAAASTGAPSRARRLLPDFSALLPQTGTERLVFAGVALSAGICEEVVFRGWLLGLLQSLGLGGMALLVAGAVAFGLAHAYQGPVGMLATGYVGALFCALFAVTGALWVPIAVHALIDLRFVLTPAARDAATRAAPAGRAEPAAT